MSTMSEKKTEQRAKVITKAQADEVKAALAALPKTLASEQPGEALQLAQKVVGIAVGANPNRLTNIGLAMVHAAQLAHGSMTPVQLLGAYGVGKASDADKAQATANLAELTEVAPQQNLRAATQHKLSAKKAPVKAPEDPKVVERRATIAKRSEEFDFEQRRTADSEKREATEKETAALALAEKKWVLNGTQWSSNGYRVGTSATNPKGQSCYVFIDDDGCGHLMQKSPDGSRWVLDLIGHVRDAAVVLLVDDEPAGAKSYYALLEEWGEGYSKGHDKRRKAEVAAEAKAASGAVEGLHGHCDTCGAACDRDGCTADRSHRAALDVAEAQEPAVASV
jgi:hypothetical protein